VDLESTWADADSILDGVRQKFVDAHQRLYGHGDRDAHLEQVSIRCRAIGRVRAPELAKVSRGGGGAAPRSREVYFESSDGWVTTAILERDSLASGGVVSGPAIIDEWTTTTIVPPGWACTVDEY